MNKNPYQIVKDFEDAVAAYAGSDYGVAVDNCSNAVFLCCKYLKVDHVVIPKKTYPSVPCSIKHAGGSIIFSDIDWSKKGFYRLEPYPIYDAAHLFKRNMYQLCTNEKHSNSFVCVSFSARKPINIGKGGMILTNDSKAVEWFRKARYFGREEKPLMEQKTFDVLGWNMYMTPEQAVRGLLLMQDADNLKSMPIPEYPDLSLSKIYEETQD